MKTEQVLCPSIPKELLEAIRLLSKEIDIESWHKAPVGQDPDEIWVNSGNGTFTVGIERYERDPSGFSVGELEAPTYGLTGYQGAYGIYWRDGWAETLENEIEGEDPEDFTIEEGLKVREWVEKIYPRVKELLTHPNWTE